jgi:hypothetical protein
MAEEERRQKNTELKKARREYTGYDDDEFTGGTAGMKRAVLAKYDDDLGTSETVGSTLAAACVRSDCKAGFPLGWCGADKSSRQPGSAEAGCSDRQQVAAIYRLRQSVLILRLTCIYAHRCHRKQ